MGSNCARTIDVTHGIERRPTTTETRAAYVFQIKTRKVEKTELSVIVEDRSWTAPDIWIKSVSQKIEQLRSVVVDQVEDIVIVPHCFAVARIGPSNFRPLLWERVTIDEDGGVVDCLDDPCGGLSLLVHN